MSDLVFPFPNMMRALPAIMLIGLFARCRNGRRRAWLEAKARTRVHVPEPGNSARITAMPTRSERRATVKSLRVKVKKANRLEGKPIPNRRELRDSIPFRPVYGHGLKAKVSQADAVAHLRTKDHDIAAKYAEAKAAEMKRVKALPEIREVIEKIVTAGNQDAAE